jgi:hypothetical protein
MTDFKLNAAGDIELDANGEVVLVSGAEEVAQKVRLRLSINKGEYFLDPDLGISYREVILVHSPNQALISAEVQREILKTQGVNRILEYSQEVIQATRQLQITFSVDTIFGPISTSVTL